MKLPISDGFHEAVQLERRRQHPRPVAPIPAAARNEPTVANKLQPDRQGRVGIVDVSRDAFGSRAAIAEFAPGSVALSWSRVYS